MKIYHLKKLKLKKGSLINVKEVILWALKYVKRSKAGAKPWWVFVSHNGERRSAKVGDKQAAMKVASDIRIGEALGLQWGDIDFNGRFINLKRSFSRGKITTLKGKRGRRVDMSLPLAETLKAHMVKSKEKGMKLGLGDHSEYVFTNRLGGFVDVNNWRRKVFVKALEKVKLRQIRIHDLRHTYATLRISKGDNIADVSNQLGHFSETFTMKIYYHWIPGKKKAEVDELDDQEFKDKKRAYDEAKQAV